MADQSYNINQVVDDICRDFMRDAASDSLLGYLDSLQGWAPSPKILCAAIEVENAAAVTALLKAKSDPNLPSSKDIDGKLPIYIAIKCMDTNILLSLLDYKADPNKRENGCHILMDMILEHDGSDNMTTKFKMMLDAGSDINMPYNIYEDTFKETSVFSLAMCHLHLNDDILQEMIKQKPNPNVMYNEDSTILQYVINEGNIEKVNILLSLGATVTIDIFNYIINLIKKHKIEFNILYNNTGIINKLEKIIQLVRLTTMMDQMYINRNDLTNCIPSMQFKCLEVLAKSDEFDVRLGLVTNNTKYIIDYPFYFTLK